MHELHVRVVHLGIKRLRPFCYCGLSYIRIRNSAWGAIRAMHRLFLKIEKVQHRATRLLSPCMQLDISLMGRDSQYYCCHL